MGDDGVRMVNAKSGFAGFMKGREEVGMPLGGYVAAQRKVREERRRVLEDAVRAEGERRRKGRKGGEESEEEEEAGGFVEVSEDDLEMDGDGDEDSD